MGGGAQVRTAIATKRTRARSVDLQAQRPDDRGPARELVVHVAPVRFGIEIAMRFECAGDQQLPVVVVGQQHKIRLRDLRTLWHQECTKVIPELIASAAESRVL